MTSALVAAATAACATPGPTRAPIPPVSTGKVRVRVFTEPTAVRVIAAAGRFVFVGTENHVERWDGDGAVLPVGLPGNQVVALASDLARGAVWVLTEGGLGYYDTAREAYHDRPEPPPGLGVDLASLAKSGASLAPSPDGGVWLGSAHGLFAIDADGTWTATPLKDPIHALAADRTGWLWLVTRAGLVARKPTGELVSIGAVHGNTITEPRLLVMLADDRLLVIGTDDAGQERLAIGSQFAWTTYRALPDVRWDAAALRGDGAVVMGGGRIYRLAPADPTRVRPLTRDGIRLVALNATSPLGSPTSTSPAPITPSSPTTTAPTPNAPTTIAPNAPNVHAPNAPTTTAPNATNVHAPNAPNVHAPNAHAPTTNAPNAHAPTTNAPNAHAPNAHAPNAHAPTTNAPNAHAPTTTAPTTTAPTTTAPTTTAPNASAPNAPTPSPTSTTSPAPAWALEPLDLVTPPGAVSLGAAGDQLLVGTRDLGTARYRDGDVRPRDWLRRRPMLRDAATLSVACTRAEDCWIATGTRRAWHWTGDRFVAGGPDRDVLAVVRDPAGPILALHRAATDAAIRFARIDANATWHPLPDLELATPGDASEISFARFASAGVLWVGLRAREGNARTPYGVAIVELATGKVTLHRTEPPDEPNADEPGVFDELLKVVMPAVRTPDRKPPLAIPHALVDADVRGDTAWFATGDGVARLARGELRQWTEDDGLRSHVVRAITIAHDGSILVATPAGIGRWDGKLWDFPAALRFDTNDVVGTRSGQVWMATERGIAAWDGHKLRRIDTRRGLAENNILDVAVDQFDRVWARGPGSLTLISQ